MREEPLEATFCLCPVGKHRSSSWGGGLAQGQAEGARGSGQGRTVWRKTRLRGVRRGPPARSADYPRQRGGGPSVESGWQKVVARGKRNLAQSPLRRFTRRLEQCAGKTLCTRVRWVFGKSAWSARPGDPRAPRLRLACRVAASPSRTEVVEIITSRAAGTQFGLP